MFRVIYTAGFIQNIDAHVRWLKAEGASETVVENWYKPLFNKLESLEHLPFRYAIDQPYSVTAGIEVRKLNHKGHVIFYHVNMERHQIELIEMLHGARDRPS